MFAKIALRMLLETDPRILFKFSYDLGWKGLLAFNKFKKRLARGENFPAVVFMSITSSCNLNCQGCWVVGSKTRQELSLADIDRVVVASKRQGSHFFGLLGGEPLLHKGLLEIPARHQDCYFQLFTNGTLITPELAAGLRKVGNVTPLISIEGLEKVSDERRGGQKVFERAMEGLDNCTRNRLITGVATSVCRSNFADVVSEEFIDMMIRRKVQYIWYYIYRPVGPAPAPELALSAGQIAQLRRFIVDMRMKKAVMIVDAYWDHEGRGLCPAAAGISHHIGPAGDIEVCPPLQYACENIHDSADIGALFRDSVFLREFRKLAASSGRGCIIMERPDLLKDFLKKMKARNTGGRTDGYDELDEAARFPSHGMEGQEIPEKNMLYRFGKKRWFFGFGAYG